MYGQYDRFADVLNDNQIDILNKSVDILSANLPINYQCDLVVNNEVFVIGSSDLAYKFVSNYSKSFNIQSSPSIDSFYGNLGNFVINVDKETSIKASILVFFIEFNIIKPQLGVLFASSYDSEVSMVNEIESLIGEFTFDKSILYFEDKCQYHHRNKTDYAYCRSCADICPNMSIISNEDKRELLFSDIDCITCGMCVGICPSGAMQKTSASLYSINKALKLYRNKMVVILSSEYFEDSIDLFGDFFKINDVFLFIVPNISMLNEVYILSILQESFRRCLIIGKSSQILNESIAYINTLYEKIFNTQAVYYADSISNINMDVIDTSPIAGYSYDIDIREFSREIFSNRLKFFIKDKDYGVLKNTEMILYTDLSINSDKCTLCMSCVEACNTNALINSKNNFSLLLNPSLCTACGFCLDVCPEQVISMPLLGYGLNNDFLSYSIKASDEPFACIECGKIFASTKSINKVKSVMQPIFANDPIKMKTILCCSDCKVKVMFNQN